MKSCGRVTPLRQSGDRKGGRVRKSRILSHERLNLGIDLLCFSVRVLEDRFDEQVGAPGIGRVVGGGDPRQHLVGGFAGHLAPAHGPVRNFAVGLALLRGLQRDVLEDDLHTGTR